MKQKNQRHIEHKNALGQTIRIWFTSKTLYGEDSHTIVAIDGKPFSSGLSFEYLENCIKYSESNEVQKRITNN